MSDKENPPDKRDNKKKTKTNPHDKNNHHLHHQKTKDDQKIPGLHNAGTSSPKVINIPETIESPEQPNQVPNVASNVQPPQVPKVTSNAQPPQETPHHEKPGPEPHALLYEAHQNKHKPHHHQHHPQHHHHQDHPHHDNQAKTEELPPPMAQPAGESHHEIEPNTEPQNKPPPPPEDEQAEHPHEKRKESAEERRKRKHKEVPKLRESKFWEKEKSKHKIQSHHVFHKLQKGRKSRLEKLLHVLRVMEKPGEESHMLEVLTAYGIPGQKKLFDFLCSNGSMPANFGDNMRMYVSHVLRARCCFNFYNCYTPLPPFVPAIQSIRYKGVHPHPEEFTQVEREKAATRRKALKDVEVIAVDEGHAAHLKELARNQLASLPVTIMHDILDDQIPVVEKLCYKYANVTGSSSSVSRLATAHYNLMRKHLDALVFIGCHSLPPCAIYRKHEEPATEENAFVTSSSSSEDEAELEAFIKQDHGPTAEELAETKMEEEEDEILKHSLQVNVDGDNMHKDDLK